MNKFLFSIVVLLTLSLNLKAQGYSGGSGTNAEPYLIGTLADLQYLSEHTEDWTLNFSQIADIDASDTETWNSGEGFSPIGNDINNFTGNYNGNHYTIESLVINRPSQSYIGLFGYIDSGSIRGIRLSNVYIEAEDYIGGLVGYSKYSEIKLSSSSGIIIGNFYVGGLIGYNSHYSNIVNCYSRVFVTGDHKLGGLLGSNKYNSTVSFCYSTGLIIGVSSFGGLIGEVETPSTIVSNCFWDTESSGQALSSGGTGLNSIQMKSICSYLDADWDFENEVYNGATDNWIMNSLENEGYPLLYLQTDMNTDEIPDNCTCYSGNIFGNGTENNPYQISTLCDLKWLSNSDSVWNKHFIQIADIDATKTNTFNHVNSDTLGFIPIGNNEINFTGTFNGKGYSIHNLYINRPGNAWIGLFGCTNGSVIDSVELTNVNILGRYYTGGLVGKSDSSLINSCNSSGVVKGKYNTGGLVGENNFSTIINSFSTGFVEGTEICTGGLVGNNISSSTINNSYSTGSVSGEENTGGLVGHNSDFSMINNCYSTDSVSGYYYTGGLLGHNNESSIIRNSYSTGYVEGYCYVGGLVGYNNSYSSIINSYSSTSVSGECFQGGFVGKNYSNAEVLNSFWDVETSGMIPSAGGIGLPTNQMKFICTYLDANWDLADEDYNGYNNYWVMNSLENNGYPELAWQGAEHTEVIPDDCSCFSGNIQGSGTEIDPYQISTICDLRWLSNIDTILNKHFIQTSNIDALETNSWNRNNNDTLGFLPIGSEIIKFTGSYNAQWYSIDNLFINRPDQVYTGFFGYTYGALIDSVKLLNVNIYGNNCTGGLAGLIHFSTIENSSCTGNVSGSSIIGGLVGKNHQSTINHCYSMGFVSGLLGNGGLVGKNRSSIITNSYSTAFVSSSNGSAGGLVGTNVNSSTISNSYSTGNVVGVNYVGGLVGYSEECYHITNSYSTGSVFGENRVGGLVGSLSFTSVINSYCTGFVSGNTNVGGLVGEIFISSAVDSYWNTELSGMQVSAVGEGLTTIQMQNYCAYLSEGWDFQVENNNGNEDFWGINENINSGFPFLTFEGHNHTGYCCNYASQSFDTLTVCDSYTVPSNSETYYFTGDYKDTLISECGTDSILNINLTVFNSTALDTFVTVCNSFIWHGTSYDQTGEYLHINECGGETTLHLTIDIDEGIDVQMACESFTWIDGITYYENNNTATYPLVNSAGCDSIVMLDLTINTVNLSLSILEPSISSNAIGVNYQWLNCDDDFSFIYGATGQTFTPEFNGSYCVKITNGACVDTSECITISTVGLKEKLRINNAIIYPNPTKSKLTVDCKGLDKIEIVDVTGKTIKQYISKKDQMTIDLSNQAKGIYLFKIYTNKGISSQKVILE